MSLFSFSSIINYSTFVIVKLSIPMFAELICKNNFYGYAYTKTDIILNVVVAIMIKYSFHHNIYTYLSKLIVVLTFFIKIYCQELKVDKYTNMKFQVIILIELITSMLCFTVGYFQMSSTFCKKGRMIDGFGKTHFLIPMSAVLYKANNT